MIKKIIILFLLYLIATNCDAGEIKTPVAPNWHTDDLNLSWFEQYFPSFYDMEYQLYMMSMYTPEDEYQILGRVNAPPYSFFPMDEGDFLLGVNAIKILEGSDWMEGPTCWSDDPECVNDGKTFYLRVKTTRKGNQDPITKWKIMWK